MSRLVENLASYGIQGMGEDRLRKFLTSCGVDRNDLSAEMVNLRTSLYRSISDALNLNCRAHHGNAKTEKAAVRKPGRPRVNA